MGGGVIKPLPEEPESGGKDGAPMGSDGAVGAGEDAAPQGGRIPRLLLPQLFGFLLSSSNALNLFCGEV